MGNCQSTTHILLYIPILFNSIQSIPLLTTTQIFAKLISSTGLSMYVFWTFFFLVEGLGYHRLFVLGFLDIWAVGRGRSVSRKREGNDGGRMDILDIMG
jgi:hypothetical protein